MTRKTRVTLDWLIPLVLLAGATVVFWVTDIDLAAERWFYEAGKGWVWKDTQPWDGLYHYGVIPAWMLSLGALGVLISSRWAGRFVPHRRICVFLVLVMITGPGLLVNDAFKKHWGRPRPLDVFAFDGDREYVPVWVKRPAGNGNSFASGHASTGYYLFVPYFFLRRNRKKWAVFFFSLGCVYGSLIGLARMIQGAHFLSDVVWAGGIVYLCALVFFYALRIDRTPLPAAFGSERPIR